MAARADNEQTAEIIIEPEDTAWVSWRGIKAVADPGYALPLLCAIGGLLYLLNLGGYPIYTKGEAREAVTIFDICHGGGVILPLRAGVEIPSKPLLMHWLAALVSWGLGGVSELSVRLPSALCAVGGMVVAYVYLRRLFDDAVGLVAAVALGTSLQYLQAGTGARVDMTLMFFMEVAFFEIIMIAEGLSRRLLLLYLAMALAVLTKGPIGVALPLLVAGTWTAVYRRWELIGRLKPWWGAIVVGGIGGGWYAAAIAVGGMSFVRKQILDENVYRLIGHAGVNVGHAHPFYYEDLALLAGFMPWTLLALPLAAAALLRRWRPDARAGYLLVWVVTVLVFYNLPQSKRGVYLLALYPALSGLFALGLCAVMAQRKAASRLTAIASRGLGAVLLLSGAAALGALYVLREMPERAHVWFARCGIDAVDLAPALVREADRWRATALLLPTIVIVSGAWLWWRRASIARLWCGLVVGIACGGLAVHLVVEPAIARTLALDGFARATRGLAHGASIGYFGSLDYDFAYYSGRDLIRVSPRAGCEFIVSPEADWNRQPLTVTAQYTVLILSNPTALDGTGRMLLLRRKSPALKLPGFYGLSI